MNLFKCSILIYGLAVISTAIAGALKGTEKSGEEAAPRVEELIAVAPPPFSEDMFPCSECHLEDDKVDPTPRVVDYHETVDFQHDKENRWCLDCHDTKNRDMLHLADGRLVSFEESYRVCGQCHSPQLKGWKKGDHGRRTGSWSGRKEYLLCANCHDPHSPSFKPLEPLPPPIRQENIQ